MSKAIITLNNICKVFDTELVETHALKNVSFEIHEGEFLSICGPSGCGKSTLLSILGLLDLPTSGQYFIHDVDASNLSLSEAAYLRNEKIGFVFQSFNLIDELSVYDNVALPMRYRKHKLSDAEVDKKVMECIAKVELTDRIEHKPNQLSGGQQQRISIARALVNEPSLLLVDEPTGNLDSRNAQMVMDTLNQLNKEGTTICMVTHDQHFADMATRFVHLFDGQITEQVASQKVAG